MQFARGFLVYAILLHCIQCRESKINSENIHANSTSAGLGLEQSNIDTAPTFTAYKVSYPLPLITNADEWQIITSWIKSTSTSFDNFDAHAIVTYPSSLGLPTCHAYCGYDSLTATKKLGCWICWGSQTTPSSLTLKLNKDYRNSLNGPGPEIMQITSKGVFKHFVYAFNNAATFAGSEMIVSVFNSNGQVGALHVRLDGAASISGTSLYRYWHTYELNTMTRTLKVINKITCDPSLSTGSTTPNPNAWENGDRRC